MSLGLFKDNFPIKDAEGYEAKYWLSKDEGRVKCILCPQGCEIEEGEAGKCLVRINRGGKLWAASYGKVAAVNIDPIEKKPLFHFYPGYYILSVGGVGCNFSCKFCQNWELVEGLAHVKSLSPEGLAELAVKFKSQRNVGIAFTYNEPTIWFEYILDTAKILKEIDCDMKVVMVTNGYISAKPLEELSDYVDAMNIDLKFAKDKLYKEVSDAYLKPVLSTIKRAWEFYKLKGKPFFELTYLIITGINDTVEDFERITDFVAELDSNIPLHISRFFPHFLMSDRIPTPEEVLFKAYEIAKKKLRFIYVGNVWGNRAEHTYCPNCGEIVISRFGFSTKVIGIKNGGCKKCGEKIFGVFKNGNIESDGKISRVIF